ncbi:hypothetical protein [Nocardia sp. NPDC047038]|uniref:hypothetical protein n=1 Tax=Nocardia sp. NPDC047038 TaxID=3154338 RepID=UPI0033F48FD5
MQFPIASTPAAVEADPPSADAGTAIGSRGPVLLRTNTPPVGLYDLIDRLMTLIGTSYKAACNICGVVIVGGVVAYTTLHHAWLVRAEPPVLAGVGGAGAGVLGVIALIRWVRRTGRAAQPRSSE